MIFNFALFFFKEGMNEDGSFIGQYGRQRKQGDNASQGFATLV